MKTYRCCPCCAVRTHRVFTLGSTMRDDHPHPCAKCPTDGRGRELIGDTVKLPQMRAA